MRTSNHSEIERWIVNRAPEGGRVLDIGCGEGDLLAKLVAEKRVRATGIELSEASVMRAIQRGLSVHHGNAEEGLDHYADAGFDLVVLNLTIQELGHPQRLLREAFRAGKQLVVTFPNFGHWTARWQLGVRGRAPSTDSLPYTWFESPNRHYLTVADWDAFCSQENWQILDRGFVAFGKPVTFLPNLRAEAAMYLLQQAVSPIP